MMTTNNFNGDKIRLARLLHGLTQQQLGDSISASRQFVHQMEGGIKQPAKDVMQALCEALQVEEAFFETPVVNDVKFEQCHFRKRKTTPVELANRVLAFTTIFEILVEIIRHHLDLPAANFPIISHRGNEYTNEEIERAAEFCRTKWGLGIDSPISRVTRALENAGVIITNYNGVSDKVDALSLNRKFPIIVRNTAKESICRMRFDLAHECGHFVLHDGIETGDSITESEADKFASAFIFPRVAFLREFPDFKGAKINWRTVYDLKIRWGMSARAIIFRAHYLDRITAQQYRGANVWLNKSGQTKVERHDEKIQPENPEMIQKAFRIMSDQLGIGSHYIAKKLGISIQLLTEITGISNADESHLDNVIPIRFGS
jgi:Zn-dependent peptidase ImmA (M78 family)/transcriptional regulator with XRE-family HTH domain